MNSKLREYNAQIRKEFKNDFANQENATESELEDDDIDNKSDDEFLKHLEKEKSEKVNMERLTKRQRMCHIAKNNLNQRG